MSDTEDLEVGEARARLREAAPSPRRAPAPVARDDAAGRVLASAVRATDLAPREPRAIMDGYALAVVPGSPPADTWRVVGESAAGHPMPRPLPTGGAARVSTGAVVPEGATVVVAQEDTTRRGDELTLAEGTSLRSGRYIRPAGSDWSPGATLLAAGTPLGPAELALLHAAGRARLEVFERPRVTIVSTGDELVRDADDLRPGTVVSTNGTMLARLAERAGASVQAQLDASDDLSRVCETLDRACATSDIVLTSGGVSVGDHDHIHGALTHLGATRLFRRVRLRPGRPVTAARVGDAMVLALPGNPASSRVTFELLARVAIGHTAGRAHRHDDLQWVEAPLAGQLSSLRTRDLYARARWRDGALAPLARQGSGHLTSIADADALILIPAGTPDVVDGSPVRALLLPR